MLSLQQSIEHEKEKVDLVANLSHDLKTPITSMIHYLDLIKHEELPPLGKDYISTLTSHTNEINTLAETLFTLTQTSSNHDILKLEPLNLNHLVEQIYADIEPQIQERELEFISELTIHDTEIMLERNYFSRICQNLFDNVLAYAAKNTRVYLKTSVTETPEKNTIHLEITNTANYHVNFTKEQLIARITRGNKTRSDDGLGVGLAIVNTHTRALGGRFDIMTDCDQFKAILAFDKVTTKLSEV